MNDLFLAQTIDPAFSSRIRLAVMALLATTEYADFRFLAEQTGATHGNLGAHVKKLVEAGYVSERKRFVERKPNTRFSITARGRRALEAHLDRLERMLRAGEEKSPARRTP